jgi:hypothetical protein
MLLCYCVYRYAEEYLAGKYYPSMKAFQYALMYLAVFLMWDLFEIMLDVVQPEAT